MSVSVDEYFERATRDSNADNAITFFRDIRNHFVYFYSANKIDAGRVTRLIQFESGELKVPYRTIDDENYAVMYTNKELAEGLLESGFCVVKSKLSQFLDIVENMNSVSGIFVQGPSKWFVVELNQFDRETNA